MVAWPGQLDRAIGLAELAEQPQRWPALGTRKPGPFRLILAPDQARFERLTGHRAPAWSAGITLPSAGTILLRADAEDLPAVLRHELAHLALHRAIRSRVPLWFDEGYAAWAAGEWDRVDALALNLAVVQGRVPPLERLNADLRGSSQSADAAYALATAAVMDIARRTPQHSLVPLLTRLARGEDFGAALHVTTGLTLDRFDEQWQKDVRHRYGILAWFLAGGLWAVLGGSLVVAAGVRRRADQPRRAALDENWVIPDEAEAVTELDPQDGQ